MKKSERLRIVFIMRFRVCAKQNSSNSKTRRHHPGIFLGKALASGPMPEFFGKRLCLEEQRRNILVIQMEEEIIIKVKHSIHPLPPPTSYHRARKGATRETPRQVTA